jgi:hypothetical protein
MKTLLEQLRPEIIEGLEKSREKLKDTMSYQFIDQLYESLENKYLYTELSVGEMRDIILWTNVDERTWDYVDWKYGTKIFVDEIDAKRN